MKRLIALVVVLVFALTGIVGGGIAANRDRTGHPGCLVVKSDLLYERTIIDLRTFKQTVVPYLRRIESYPDPTGKYTITISASKKVDTFVLRVIASGATLQNDYSFTVPYINALYGEWSSDGELFALIGTDSVYRGILTKLLRVRERRIMNLPAVSDASLGWMDNNRVFASYALTSTSFVIKFYDVETGQESQFTFDASNIIQIQISPQHRYVTQIESKYGRTEVTVLTPMRGVERVFDLEGDSDTVEMRWSPDESAIMITQSNRIDEATNNVTIAFMDGRVIKPIVHDEVSSYVHPRWTKDSKGIILLNATPDNGYELGYLDAETGEFIEKPMEKLGDPIVRLGGYITYGFTDAFPHEFITVHETATRLSLATESREFPQGFTMSDAEWVVDFLSEDGIAHIIWVRLDGSEKHEFKVQGRVEMYRTFTDRTPPSMLLKVADGNEHHVYFVNFQSGTYKQLDIPELLSGQLIEPLTQNATLLTDEKTGQNIVTRFSSTFEILGRYTIPNFSGSVRSAATSMNNRYLALLGDFGDQRPIIYIAHKDGGGSVASTENIVLALMQWTLDGGTLVTFGNGLAGSTIRIYAPDGSLLFERIFTNSDYFTLPPMTCDSASRN